MYTEKELKAAHKLTFGNRKFFEQQKCLYMRRPG